MGRGAAGFAKLRKGLARYLLPLLGAASLSVTLMACYGSSSYYDCQENGSSCDEECSSSSDCPADYFCDESNRCEWGGPCQEDIDCPDEYVCVENRLVCEPGDRPPPGFCISTLDCEGAQICDLDTQQCIDPGCDLTGCLEGFACDATSQLCEPCASEACEPPTCEALQSESECFEREDCNSVYRGIDCHSPSGADCSEQAPCICDSFLFDHCAPSAAPVPPG